MDVDRLLRHNARPMLQLADFVRWRRHPLFRVLAMTDRVVVQATPTAESDAAAAVKRVAPSVRAMILPGDRRR